MKVRATIVDLKGIRDIVRTSSFGRECVAILLDSDGNFCLLVEKGIVTYPDKKLYQFNVRTKIDVKQKGNQRCVYLRFSDHDPVLIGSFDEEDQRVLDIWYELLREHLPL